MIADALGIKLRMQKHGKSVKPVRLYQYKHRHYSQRKNKCNENVFVFFDFALLGRQPRRQIHQKTYFNKFARLKIKQAKDIDPSPRSAKAYADSGNYDQNKEKDGDAKRYRC